MARILVSSTQVCLEGAGHAGRAENRSWGTAALHIHKQPLPEPGKAAGRTAGRASLAAFPPIYSHRCAFISACCAPVTPNPGGLMPITKLPDMVACTDAVLASADADLEDALLTVTLRTERGERYSLRLSERAITQMLEIISECHRTTDFLGQEEDPELITLQ
jgi:hypothetical protein